MKRKDVFRLIALTGVVLIVGLLASNMLVGLGFLVAMPGGLLLNVSSKILKEQRELKTTEIEALLESYEVEEGKESEARSTMDEADVKIYNRLMKEVEELDVSIAETERLEEFKARSAGKKIAATQKTNELKEVRNYSFVKAIRSKMMGEQLEGFEMEMHQEAVKEARDCGTKVSGIGVPFMVLSPEKRTILAGTETDIIPTEFQGFIDILMARLAIKMLGANFLTGLTSNLSIPRLTGQATASWKDEDTVSAESTHTFDAVSLSPNKLTTYTQYSKQMIMQSAVGIENLVRNDLVNVSTLALDAAAINGSGTAPTPRGILNTSGIGSVAIGLNGGAPTYELLVALVKELAVDNADMGSLGFLTNPYVKAKLQTTKLDAGSGLFVWPQGVDSLMGYKTAITTQVPADLTKGTSDDCSAIIYGNFNDLLIGQWGGMDLIVDPYTQATYDYTRVIIHSYWDIDVRHAESFAAIKDARTTL